MQPQAFIQLSGRSISQTLATRPPIAQIKQIHAQIITRSLNRLSLIDSLIHSYLHTKNLRIATTLFDRYPSTPPILLWNLMIRAQNSSNSISLFRRMMNLSCLPDAHTFTFLITSLARHGSVLHGRIIHGMAIKTGHLLNLYLANSLINMYAVFAMADNAEKVFDEMPERDVFSWTSLVSAHAKTGSLQKAGKVFDQMPVRNEVSWVVMISGLVGHGMYAEAIEYFHKMLYEVRPNEAVLVCVLSACARLGSLDQGNQIRGYIDKNGIPETSNIRTALIDMYAKCGRIDCAYRVFDKIAAPDVQNYTSLISGLSIHGLGEEAVRVFRQMLIQRVSPNDITILGVLNGCSHSGLVQQGTSIFYNMENLCGVTPKIEHYGCYVDLLGRAGYLAKAFGMVKQMPVNPDMAIWRALLSACRIHRNAGFGERIRNHLEHLYPSTCAGADVLLSNTYASIGKWEKVAIVRETMDKQRNRLDIGRSWIEVNGIVHEFRVADVLHPQIQEIRDMLSEILKRVRLVGYATDATHALFDLSRKIESKR